MKNTLKLSLISAVLGASSLMIVSSIRAQNPISNISIDVFMTFTEPVMDKHCPLENVGGGPGQGFCGSGEVIPLGHASETIEFAAGCGGACDRRTINLPDGSIFTEETFTFISGHGTGEDHQGKPSTFSGTLADIIIGGTGMFEGATGFLNGTVRVAGKANQVKLSGTIVLAPTH